MCRKLAVRLAWPRHEARASAEPDRSACENVYKLCLRTNLMLCQVR